MADFGAGAGKFFKKKVPAAQEVSTSSDVAEAVDSSENGLMKPVEPEASEKIIKPGIPSQKKKPKFSLKNLFKKKRV